MQVETYISRNFMSPLKDNLTTQCFSLLCSLLFGRKKKEREKERKKRRKSREISTLYITALHVYGDLWYVCDACALCTLSNP